MIRHANENDASTIHELLKQIVTLHHKLYPEDFPNSEPKYELEQVVALINDETKTVLVYEEDNTVWGYLIGWNNKDFFFIDDLCVDENKRGHSIGKQLVDYIEESLNISHIQLNVWLKNTGALSFYERLGFETLKYVLRKKKN